MGPTVFTRTTLMVLIVIAIVGAVDAGGSDEWDLVVIFGALLIGLVFLLARTALSRPLVPIRGDLVRWLAARANVNGERVGHVAAQESDIGLIAQPFAVPPSRIGSSALLHRDQIVLPDDRYGDTFEVETLGSCEHDVERRIEGQLHGLPVRMTEVDAVGELTDQAKAGSGELIDDRPAVRG